MQDENDGRVAQKARTRTALLQSAISLMQKGERPTVEEAAKAADISKRTAYRYFTSQDHMLADAALESLRPEFAKILRGPRGNQTAGDRLETLIRELNRLAPDYENELRVIVRAALDQPPEKGKKRGRSRGQRRVDWIVDVLEPLKAELPADLYERLAAALTVVIGFDTYVFLRDVMMLEGEAVDDTMVWMGRSLIEKTLAEAKARKSPASRPRKG